MSCISRMEMLDCNWIQVTLFDHSLTITVRTTFGRKARTGSRRRRKRTNPAQSPNMTTTLLTLQWDLCRHLRQLDSIPRLLHLPHPPFPQLRLDLHIRSRRIAYGIHQLLKRESELKNFGCLWKKRNDVLLSRLRRRPFSRK